MQEIELRVNRANTRPSTLGEFFAQVHPSMLKEVKSGQFVVLHKDIDGRIFSIPAILYKSDEVEPTEIRIYQKLRHAIGANVGDIISISLRPELNKGFFRRLIRSYFGVQVNLARVKCATFNDMEISVCRINAETMKNIGIDEGDVVVLESSTSSIRIRALELTENNIKEILEGERDYPNNYPDCFTVLKRERFDVKRIDLPWLLIDYDTRQKLGIAECDPVRVSRSIRHTLTKQMHLISLPLILAVIGAIFSFSWDNSLKMTILFISLIVVIFLNLLEIKERVHS